MPVQNKGGSKTKKRLYYGKRGRDAGKLQFETSFLLQNGKRETLLNTKKEGNI